MDLRVGSSGFPVPSFADYFAFANYYAADRRVG
jgi:hypothetical protein